MIKLGEEVKRLTFEQLEKLFLQKYPEGMIVEGEGYGSVEVCFNKKKDMTKKATNEAGEVVGYYREARPKWCQYRGSYKVIGTRLGLVKDHLVEEAKRGKQKEEERISNLTDKEKLQEKKEDLIFFWGWDEAKAEKEARKELGMELNEEDEQQEKKQQPEMDLQVFASKSLTKKEVVKKWYKEFMNSDIKIIKETEKGIEVGQEFYNNSDIAARAIDLDVTIKGYKIKEIKEESGIPIHELYGYEDRIYKALKKAGIEKLKENEDYSKIHGIGQKSVEIINDIINKNIQYYKEYKLIKKKEGIKAVNKLNTSLKGDDRMIKHIKSDWNDLEGVEANPLEVDSMDKIQTICSFLDDRLKKHKDGYKYIISNNKQIILKTDNYNDFSNKLKNNIINDLIAKEDKKYDFTTFKNGGQTADKIKTSNKFLQLIWNEEYKQINKLNNDIKINIPNTKKKYKNLDIKEDIKSLVDEAINKLNSFIFNRLLVKIEILEDYINNYNVYTKKELEHELKGIIKEVKKTKCSIKYNKIIDDILEVKNIDYIEELAKNK